MLDSIPDRYEHNPMLILVENYILDALGLLEPDKAAKLNEIITRTFGGTNWRTTIQEQFQLPPDTPTALKTLWQQRQEEADTKQEDLSPELFAQQIAVEFIADMGGT